MASIKPAMASWLTVTSLLATLIEITLPRSLYTLKCESEVVVDESGRGAL